MHTNLSEQPFRSARALGRRFAAVAAASAVAVTVTVAAWGASGSAASTELSPGITAGAEDRIIGNGTDSYAPIVRKVAPAVVTVRSERRAPMTQQRLPFFEDPRFREFFGDRFGEGVPVPQPRQGGLGSGVLVNSEGYILTNHHVIDRADKVKVELSDRRTFDAQIIGSDAPSDLAVLKIDAVGLPIVALGDSELVNVGDIVLALGNPMGVGQTVTMGIISAKGRATGLGDGGFEDFLQTDAPINTGNSGGALVNTRGELVGINSQILSPSGGNIGIGFSIPVNMARAVMDALIEHGEVRRGRLGVTVQPITSDLAASLDLKAISGALVNQVQSGSAAERAGIERGDVIVAIDAQPVSDSNELRNRIAQLGPEAQVELTIVRDGETRTVNATLDALPSNSASSDGPSSSQGEPTAGLAVEPLTPQRARQMGLAADRGLLVTRVDPNGPAAEAGIRRGDVIREVDGRVLTSSDELRRALTDGDRPALVLVQRGELSMFVPLPRVG